MKVGRRPGNADTRQEIVEAARRVFLRLTATSAGGTDTGDRASVAELTEGRTLRANQAMVIANARLAAQVARAISSI